MSVPLTQEQQNSPLYPYYELDIEPIPPEEIDEVMKMPFNEQDGLDIEDINRLFEDGYLPGEAGVFRHANGGLSMAFLTDMPGVTPEMIDWWFAWHGLDSMRYIIWDKDDHYACRSENPEIHLDSSRSMKERYRHTCHHVEESLITGKPSASLELHFLDPEEVGFDPEKVKQFPGTIVCTGGQNIMVHFFRPTSNGVELRTRFWTGYRPENNRAVRVEGLDLDTVGWKERALVIHNKKEYRHLAKILPDLYSKFKDDFYVGLSR